MIWVLSQSKSPWQRSDAIKCFSVQGVFLKNRLREYVPENPEINCQQIYPASFMNIENREGFQIGPQI